MATKKFEIVLRHDKLKIYAFHGEKIPVCIEPEKEKCGVCTVKNEDGGYIGKVKLFRNIELVKYNPTIKISDPDAAGRHHITGLCLNEIVGQKQIAKPLLSVPSEVHEYILEE